MSRLFFDTTFCYIKRMSCYIPSGARTGYNIVPLHAVQRRCSSADLPLPGRKGSRGSIKIEQSRNRAPKTLWLPFTRVDEHRDNSVSKACSPYPCAHKNRDGKAWFVEEGWMSCTCESPTQLNVEASLAFISQPGNRMGSGDQES